jgi:transposase-like protein
MVPNCSREALRPIIQGQILEGSTVHTDGWSAYDGLVVSGVDPYRVFQCKNAFARGKSHVNGMEAFWELCEAALS